MIHIKYNSLLQIITLIHVAYGAEKLVVQEIYSTFTSSSVQWSSNAVTQCQTTDFTEFSNQSVMGFFGLGDNTSTKTFTNIPPHWSLSIRFDLILYQSLDINEDQIFVKINGNTDTYVKKDPGGGYKTCIPSNQYGDELVLYYYNITHSSSSIAVTINSQTNEPIYNEGFGFKNFYLYVDTCHDSCLTCNGPTAAQCLGCPSNSTPSGNTCTCNAGYSALSGQCILTCQTGYIKDSSGKLCVQDFCSSSTCNSCQNGLCTSCKSGFYLLNGYCVSSCPSYSTLNGQQCKDLISSTSYGSYLLQTMFNTNFGESEVKGAGLAISGFSYNLQPSRAFTTVCNGKTILGGAYLSSHNAQISRQFTGLQPHWSIAIGYTLYKIDSWENENVQLLVDGNVVATTTKGIQDGGTNLCGRVQFNDLIIQVPLNFTHTSSSLKLQFQTNLDSDAFDESYGIRELYVLVDYCSPNCITCDAKGCSKCSFSYFLYNYQCVSVCPDSFASDPNKICKPCDSTCLTCSNPQSNTSCLTCKPNSYLNPNKSCLNNCPSQYWTDQTNWKCQNCVLPCYNCQSPGLFLQNNQCISKCDDSYYVFPQTNICQKCYSSCQTCSGPSQSECLSCTSSLNFLKNSCLSECPHNYFTDQQQQAKECKICHSYCKLGCKGPSQEDCDSIKYQYQIILYILSGKSFIWVASSIFGYFYDKKQSKIFTDTNFPPLSANSDRISNLFEQQKEESLKENNNNNQNEQKQQMQNQTEAVSQQNEKDQLELQAQTLQFQMKFDLDKMKRVGNRRPRQKFYKQSFYDKSTQIFECQLPYLNTNQPTFTKSISQFVPTQTNLINPTYLTDQKELNKRGVQVILPYIYKFKANQIFKFTILGNEWVSLFYFYDTEASRFIRATLIFLKYQAFFLSTEYVYENFQFLLIFALLVSLSVKQTFKIIQLVLVRKSFKLTAAIVFFFIAILAEKLVVQEITSTFTSSSIQWSSNTVSQCQTTDLTEFSNQSVMGFFGQGTTTSSKTFTNIPPHWSLSIRFDLILYQSLDWNDYIYVKINGNTDSFQKVSAVGGYKMCYPSNAYADELVLYHYNITHSSSSLTVTLQSLTDEPISNEGYGFKNFYLYADTCHDSCLTCNGPTENQCLTCPSNSTPSGNKCTCYSDYSAQSNSCIQTCQTGYVKDSTGKLCVQDFCSTSTCNTCVSGLCTSCKSGFYLLNGYCVSSCPSYSTLSGQQCLDLKSSTSYGSYLLQTMFNTYFGESEVRGAGLTIAGFSQNLQATRALTTVCNGKTLLGGAYLSSLNAIISRQFTGLQPHWSITIGYTLYKIDSWDNENVQLVVDGNVLITTTCALSDGGANLCGRVQYNDQIIQNSKNFTHTSTSLSIKFQTNLDTDAFDESYGIRELYVLVDYCSPNCLTCDAKGCSKCSSTFFQYNYQCVSVCPDGFASDSNKTCQPCDFTCLTCSAPQSNTSCLTCKSNTYLNPNKSCQSNCPANYWTDQTNWKCQNCDPSCYNCKSPGLFLENKQCLSKCDDSYFVLPSTNICQKCDTTCFNCKNPGLFLQNNQCLSKCDDSNYVVPQTNICQKCDSLCQTCSGPSQSECLSCSSSLTFLNNSCLSECPSNYFTDQSQQTKECKICHSYCKLGCKGPLEEDCDSIKYQYQIIFYILSGKSLIWVVSSLFGHFYDKKQSKTFTDTNFPPISANNEKISNITEQQNDNQFLQENNKNYCNEEKSQIQNPTDIASQQNPQDQLAQQVQTLQFQIKFDLDKMKRVGNRRPRQKFQKNHFYDRSQQTFECQLPYTNTHQSSLIKSISQFVPTSSNLVNQSYISNQQELNKRGVQVILPYIYKYNTNQIFKFTIDYFQFLSTIPMKYNSILQIITLIHVAYGAEKLVVQEITSTFTSSSVQLSSNAVTQYQTTDFTGFSNQSVMEFFGLGDNTSTKTFTNIPPHWNINEDYIYVKINGNTDTYVKKVPGGGYKTCIPSNQYGDELVLYYNNITHSSSSIAVTINSQKNKPIYNEGFGFKNFYLYVDICHDSCLTCNEPTASQCLSCPSNSTPSGNTCTCNAGYSALSGQCILTCQTGYIKDSSGKLCVQDFCSSSTCNSCQNGLCNSCKSGFYLLNGYCVSSCPSYSTLNGQQCKDLISSTSYGSYLLQTMFNTNFGESEVKGAGLAISGFSYNLQPSRAFTTVCNGKTILGGAYLSSHNAQISRQFTGLQICYILSEKYEINNQLIFRQPHWSIALGYTLYKIDSWENENVQLLVDGNVVATTTNGIQDGGTNLCGRVQFNDLIIQVPLNFTYTSSSLKLQFQTNLDSDAFDESYGIRELYVLVDYCSPNCITCDAKGCSKCSFSYFLYNYQCVSVCPDSFASDPNKICKPCDSTCLTCSNPQSNTSCLTCKPNTYLNPNKSCLNNCPSQYWTDQTNWKCQNCVLPCYNCKSPGLFLQNNQCISKCDDSYYVVPQTNICQKCYSSCQTCSGPSQSEFNFLNNSCLTECPHNYFTDQQQQAKEFKICHCYCKLGCKGPSQEDCDSIKYQYQIIFYILSGKSFIWVVSSIFGYFYDKKQSKIFTDTNFRPLSINSDRISNLFEQQKEQFLKENNNNNNENEQKQQTQNQTEAASQQNEKDQLELQAQNLQFQIKFDLDKMKRVGNRRPRQKFYKQSFYDKSAQIFECQLPYLNTNQPTFTKSISQFVPTQTNLINPCYLTDQKESNKRGFQVILPKIYKFKANQIFKFTILGNEWVSLFYFYDTEASRFIRATLIFQNIKHFSCLHNMYMRFTNNKYDDYKIHFTPLNLFSNTYFEQLVVQEITSNFTSSSVQWSSNTVTQCQITDLTEFSNQSVMGFFGRGTTTSSKTFTNIPPHWSLSIRFDLILYQSLDWNDYIYVKINGNTDSFQKISAGGGYRTCYPTIRWGDELVLYHYNITHSSSSLTVTLQSLTDEPISNEGYGFKNFYLYADTCHDSCLTCNGPTENQCLTCPLNSTPSGNKCTCNSGYSAQSNSCIQTCQTGYVKDSTGKLCVQDFCSTSTCNTCLSGLCTSCKSGFYLLNGYCVSSCPSYSTLSGQQCQDLKSSTSYGSYLLQTMFNTYFGESEVRGAGLTIAGFSQNLQATRALTTVCNGKTLLGGAYLSSLNATMSTQFTGLQPHWSIAIGYTLYKIDSWENENVQLVVDGNVLITTTCALRDGGANLCGRVQYNDQIIQISKNFTHTSTQFSITFQTNLDSDAFDESYGIRELYVLVDYCPPNCLTCDAKGCSKCSSTFFQYNYQCVSVCPDGFLSDSNKTCQPCDSTCLTCSAPQSNTSCLTCKSNKYLNLNKSCQSNCPANYWTDQTNWKCQNCDPSCYNCKSPGQFLENKQCLSKCDDSYFVLPSTNICQKCDTTCFNCKNPGQFLENKQCLSKCDDSYFVLPSTNICQKCDTTCFNCKNPGQFLENKQCLSKCDDSYFVLPSTNICQKCDTTCFNCKNPGLFLQNNKCLSRCDDSNYVIPQTIICQKCDSSCQTCSGPSQSECLSCSSSLIFLNNSCLSECPSNYFTDQSQQSKGCKICHSYCKLGCKGPLDEDCDSIKCQYQIIFYILSGKSLIWVVSSLFGHFYDKKQSKIFTDTNFPPLSVNNEKISNIIEQQNDNQFLQENNKNYCNEEKSQMQNQIDIVSQQNPQDQLAQQVQTLQFQIKFDIDKMKRVGNRKLRKNYYKNHFYDRSQQNFECQQPYTNTHQSNLIKSISQLVPTSSNLVNPSFISNQQELNKREVQVILPYIFKYKANEIFKFTIANSCSQCYSTCKTCSEPSQEQCLSCSPNQFFLKNNCYSNCPESYYAGQLDKQCKECHGYCKKGCSGPLKEDCDSIKYKNQIILFILVGKTFFWIVSSIVGYLQDKKQSKVFTQIINSPDTINSDRASKQLKDNSQTQIDKTEIQQSPSKAKMLQTFSQEFQQQQQYLSNQGSVVQFQSKLSLNKENASPKKRPRKFFHKNIFYEQSLQGQDCPLINFQSRLPAMIKNTIQASPTISNLLTGSQSKNQKDQETQEATVQKPKEKKNKASKIFKF
ncbi:hypothetical protein ABPG72_015421 [Tetrahymena utriculariae]